VADGTTIAVGTTRVSVGRTCTTGWVPVGFAVVLEFVALEVGAVVAPLALVGLARAWAVCVPARIELIALLGRGVGKGRLPFAVGVTMGAFEADFSQADTEEANIMINKIIQNRFFIR